MMDCENRSFSSFEKDETCLNSFKATGYSEHINLFENKKRKLEDCAEHPQMAAINHTNMTLIEQWGRVEEILAVVHKAHSNI